MCSTWVVRNGQLKIFLSSYKHKIVGAQATTSEEKIKSPFSFYRRDGQESERTCKKETGAYE